MSDDQERRKAADALLEAGQNCRPGRLAGQTRCVTTALEIVNDRPEVPRQMRGTIHLKFRPLGSVGVSFS